MRTFTPSELAAFDGREGQPVYIAHHGRVYDVSGSKMWRGGRHMKRHSAGTDLTADIQAAPHGLEVLERFPQVGVLQPEAAAAVRPLPGWLTWLMEGNPFLRRHPHPMTVHFPIAFMLANPCFNLLYLATDNAAFDNTAYHCLGGGILFMAVAMVTGFLTWWYNYLARMMKPVAIKIALSVITLLMAIGVFAWRWSVPDVLTRPEGGDGLYLTLSLAFIPLISIVGWYGATLTFPLEKE
jgi:predicted heme/steroid binding protein/uncharacterized membrane protein